VNPKSVFYNTQKGVIQKYTKLETL